jgi:hypothetical protein
MRLEISTEGTFVPEFNGNKKLPATDQITVRYRTPTVVIKNRCRRKPQAKGIAAANGSIDRMEIVIEKDEIATLNEMLVSISGCSYRSGPDDGETSITRAQDLLNAPIAFEPLLKEITAEFDRLLDHAGIDEKN